jgi:hypothetical protein
VRLRRKEDWWQDLQGRVQQDSRSRRHVILPSRSPSSYVNKLLFFISEAVYSLINFNIKGDLILIFLPTDVVEIEVINRFIYLPRATGTRDSLINDYGQNPCLSCKHRISQMLES